MSDFNEIDVLRARAIASMPSKQKLKSRPVGKQPEVEREEGELCSSDDDQVPLSSQPVGSPTIISSSSSDLTSWRGLPSNNPRLGEHPDLVPQEKVLTTAIPGASNILMTEATSSAANGNGNGNGNAIVRKSEFLSGLIAPAPFTISMKPPTEVEITKFSVASQTQAQTPLADVDTARHHESSVQFSEREPTTLRGLVDGSAKKVPAAAPVYRPTANGSSVRQPITLGNNSGRAGNMTNVSKGTPRISFIAAHKPFSPPFAASHKPFSPVIGARSSIGAPSQPAPYSADRTEADNFLAGLTLPGSIGTNSEFIINFDDSDSDEDRGQTRPAQVQPRSSVNRIGAAGDKSIPRTLPPPNRKSEPNRLRVGRRTIMSYNNTSVNNRRARTMVRPASLSTPPRPDAQIETLRQLIAAKESQIEQNKRVNQVPEPRSRAAAISLTQDGTQKAGSTVGNPLAVNSASKTSFKKKPRISNLAHAGSRLTGSQTNGAEPSERGRGKVDILVSGKSSNYQVSTRPSEGNVAIQQANVSLLGVKESKMSSCRSIEEVQNIAPGRGAAVIPAGTAAETSRTGTSRGAATVFSTKPDSYVVEPEESDRRNNSGNPVIKSGVPEVDNEESIQIAPEATGTRKEENAIVSPVAPPRQSGGNGPSSSAVVSGERHLEPMWSEQVQGLGLKKRGFALEHSTDHQKKKQLDQSSNVIIQPSIRSVSAHLGNCASEVRNDAFGASADGDNLLAKRRRTDEPSPQVFNVVGHTTASVPPLSSLPERRSEAQSCPPYPSSTDQVEKCGGESRITHPKNGSNSASALRLDNQLHSESQKHSTLDDNVSSRAADILPMNALRDSSGLNVRRSTSAHFSNSQVDDSQLIRNGENISEMANATVSRALEAQKTDSHLVTAVDGEGVSCGSLQPSGDHTNFVSTPHAAGIQIMNNDGNKTFPAATKSTHVMQSDVPDKLSLRDNNEFVPDLGDRGGYRPWPTSQHFETCGSHLEQLRMQHTVAGGSGGYSLENLREEEDSVDKDLEEAQAHRRDCEIRERELRRAYREAEIALRKANARCEALSQRQKYLNVQVQTVELRQLQQPSFSIHSNSTSLVPFNNITLPRITELHIPRYSPQVGCTAKPPTEYELGFVRLSNEHEARIQSSPQVDYHTLKVPSSSADTEILEENIDRTTDHGTRLSGGHIPSAEEATVGDKNALSVKDIARHYGFCSEGEVSLSTNSESATSSQRLKIKKLTETVVTSDAVGQGELRSNNSVVLEDFSYDDQDPLNRPMAAPDSDVAVPGNKGGFHTPFTSTSIGLEQAEVTETEVDKEALSAREIVNSTLETDRGLLEQDETRTAFGIDQILHTPGQKSYEDGGEVIRDRRSPIQKRSTTDKEPSHILNVLGDSLNDLGSATEEAFANVAEQDMDMDSKVPKRLQAHSRSDGIPNSELMTSKHGSGDVGCRDHHSDLPAVPGLIIILKNKREISGLRALAENDELQHLDKGCEDTSDYIGEIIRPSSLEDPPVEEETFGPSGSVKYQGLSFAQTKDSEVTGDKGECTSRTSALSEGAIWSLQGEQGSEDGSGNGIDEVCLKLPSPGNSAENHSGDLAGEDPLVRTDVLHTSKNLVLDDSSVRLHNMQLPSTALSIGFAYLGTGNFPALCLVSHQVVTDKRFDESTFHLASYESPLTMFRSYRMCSAFQTAWHNKVTSQTWSHMLDPFKPLCMFEHRGKCNDDACPWQHMADYTLNDADLLSQLSNYLNTEQQDEAQKLSSETTSVSLEKIINGASRNAGSIISNKFLLPRPFTSNRGSPAPFYKIGPYSINQDESLTSRVRCCLSNQYKFNLFTSFTLSSAVRRPMHSDIACLPTGFFYFDSQTTTADSSGWRYTGERSLATMEEHVHNEPGDIEAWLELALTRIDFDLNCTDNETYNEALYVLSRALEANPSVATLWIVYIGLFYHGKGEIGDDDLFYHAIENSKGSYELLLLYINSRTTLPERLKAYELALEALVNVGEHGQGSSACILDVSIQMLDCMCVAEVTHLLHTWSEDVVKASGTAASVLTCLTPEDCCILMVACAYAVAFGHLPQNYLLRLGCRQQLPWDIDWSRRSCVQEDSKDLVLKVMEAGMHYGPVLSQDVSEQVLTVNYLKCLALYHECDHALRLSWQIIERHSTCLELVLFIVHLETKKGWKEVFQQALQNPSKGSVDQQRLWYQYAVHALKVEGSVGAVNILHQCASAAYQGEWENCIAQVDYTRKALQLNIRKFENVDGSCMVSREAVFAWMNLALYEMLSGNEVDAQYALEKSIKAAVIWEDVLLCWKEMASFIRFSKTGQEQAGAILDLLDRGSVATGVSCKLVPLATKLLSPISKRRVRVFLEFLMGPPSIDHSLINSLVEVIISKETSVSREVAMIVEAVMEIFPGNHELMLQIFRSIGNLDTVADMSSAVWISSLLFGSLLQTSPQACEQHWVEAGHLLEKLQDESSLRSFYQFALVLHPFSASLKRSASVFDDSSKPVVL